MDYGTPGPARDSDGLPEWVEWGGEKHYTPAFEEIQGWVYDSVCESLQGSTVEPDGTDPDGCPSWLLALGLV